MISDLTTLVDDLTLECDVCVVGAGAAGLAMAVELANTSLDVVVLEAGGEAVESVSQDFYAAHTSAHAFTGHLDGRVRVLGGTTTRWGGQALRLSPWDFSERPWIAGSGWPLPYDEVARHYPRATELLGLDALDYGAKLATRLGATLPPFDLNELIPYFAKWSPHPNFAARYGSVVRRAHNVRLLLHANLTTIELQDSHVALLHARTLEGKRLAVRPRNVVLATGGLEVPRLLLANRAQRTRGIGNEFDLVGRFLQDHPGGRFGTVAPADDARLQRAFNVYHRRGVRYSVRFALPPAVQRAEEVASASATLMFEPGADSTFDSLKRVYALARARRFDREMAAAIGRCARDFPGVTEPIAAFLRGRVFTPNARASLFVTCEQEPDPTSRVTLTEDRDALGMPRLDIHWCLSELTARTIRALARRVEREVERLGFGVVRIDDWVSEDEWSAHVDDHFHHMGTTRMATTPDRGVVDTNCAVHGVPNLYVASSSVFPTGGFANPTLTILALAVRLADRLKSA